MTTDCCLRPCINGVSDRRREVQITKVVVLSPSRFPCINGSRRLLFQSRFRTTTSRQRESMEVQDNHKSTTAAVSIDFCSDESPENRRSSQATEAPFQLRQISVDLEDAKIYMMQMNRKRLLKYFDCFHLKKSANENQQDDALKPCEFDYISPKVSDSVVEQAGETLEIYEFDYISRLPDSIVHHIYSLLHPIDVASTSVLSKTWNNFWCRYSFALFHFIYHSYYPTEQNKQVFLNLFERAVSRRIGGELYLQRFQMHIEFADLPMLKAYLNRWISIAIGKSVAEFALRVEIALGSGFRSRYSVPQVVLQAESLRVLSLSGCAFPTGFDVRLPNLKKLSLHRCEFEDELMFRVLMCGWLKVEYVKISESDFKCKTLSLMNLPLLKHFESLQIENIVNVEIYAANLETFSFSAASRRWPQRFDLNSCASLKELRFVGARRFPNFTPEHLISQLPSLQVLEFEDFYDRSHDLVIPCQMLKKLAFRNCRALRITANTPNLQSLEICYSGDLFIPISASTILNVHLILDGNSLILLHRLTNFLSTRTSLVDLKLVKYDKSSKKMIIHESIERLSEISLPSFYLMSQNYICISSKNYTDLMNELIPQVYPKHVYLKHTHDGFVKEILEKIKDVSRNPNSQGTLVGFQVNKCADIKDLMDPVASSFIEKYSIPPYRDSVLSLDWRMRGDVSGGRKVLL